LLSRTFFKQADGTLTTEIKIGYNHSTPEMVDRKTYIRVHQPSVICTDAGLRFDPQDKTSIAFQPPPYAIVRRRQAVFQSPESNKFTLFPKFIEEFLGHLRQGLYLPTSCSGKKPKYRVEIGLLSAAMQVHVRHQLVTKESLASGNV
jgi:hypothetical protein